MFERIKDYLRINWIKFFFYNFFLRRSLIRKKRCYLVPYFKTSVKIRQGGKIHLNATVHIGSWNALARRNKTNVIVQNNGILLIESRFSMARGGLIDVNGGRLKLNGGAMNCDTFIKCVDSISVGKNCLISRDVIIRDDDGHKILRGNYHPSKPVAIGDNVWICERAAILKGSAIGNNVVIGFGTVVKGKIDSGVSVGNKSNLAVAPIDGWEY